MAKNKKSSKSKRAVSQQASIFESVEFDQRTYFLVLLALGLLYIFFSYRSTGVYQDDEIGHFMNSQKFWSDPSSILTYWNRPGFKLVYAIPALFGVKAVHLTSIFLTLLTCHFTYLLAKQYELKNNLLTAILFGLQPMVLQLSFRTYSEVLAGFLITLMLLAYLREKFILSALAATYLFTVRQEYAAIALIMGGFFLYKRRLLPFLILGLSPVILNIMGWMKTGHALWLFQDYLPIGQYQQVQKPGFFHFWKMFEPTFGTIPAVLFLLGFFSFGQRRTELKHHFARYHALYIIFTVIFVIQCLLTSTFVTSPSPGLSRYLVPLAPVVALFATIGFERIWTQDQSTRNLTIFFFLALSVLVVTTLSHKHNHYVFTPEEDFSKAIVLGLFTITIFACLAFKIKAKALVLVTALLITSHTLYAEKPIPKSPEYQAVEDLARWYQNQGFEDRVLLFNHSVFYYTLGKAMNRADPKFPGLYMKTLREAPAGAIAIWDTHYSYRPSFKMDVKFEFFKNNPDYKFLKQFNASNKRYTALVFEKIH